MRLQPQQGIVPAARDQIKMTLRVRETADVDRPDVLAAAPLAGDDPRRRQDVEVLGHALAGGPKVCGQRRDRRWTGSRQVAQDGEPRWIAECREQQGGGGELLLSASLPHAP